MDIEAGKAIGTSTYDSDNCAKLAWKDLRVAASEKGHEKVILHDVNGYVLPGGMLAIMGPSGCGKSTLLDTLAGRKPKGVSVSGQVLLNGHKSSLAYGVSAYVTQDEVLVGVLTVRETLMFSALLRLPASMTRAEKEARVDSVLADMGLVDAANTKIGNWYLKGVSGGQKRRVSIGCELVTHPSLIFLDEPTSGLDAASAYYVMDSIRKLAAQQRTVLTVIHQPSSEVFELFDKLCLLSGGKVIFFGDAPAALQMFDAAGLPCPSTRSATDHFLHCINQDFQGTAHSDTERNIVNLIDVYNKTIHPNVIKSLEDVADVQGPVFKGHVNEANPIYQSLVLTHRNLVNNMRNVGVFWLRLGMFLMLCICIGTIFFDLGDSWKDTYSRASMLFFIVAFLTFMSISSFPAFVEDMQVFLRERLNGYYRVSSFVIANTLASIPFIFAIAFLASCVVYWLVDLNDTGDRFPFFFMNLFAALLVVESLMMAIAPLLPHYLMGIAAGAGILGMFMLVCGFFQPVGSIPKPVWRYPLHYIAYHTYAFSGFMHNEFGSTTGWGCPCEDQAGGCAALGAAGCTVQGEEVLNYWLTGAARDLQKWASFGIQLGMVAGYRIIFWGMLVLKEFLTK